jgi:hypothetical protein
MPDPNSAKLRANRLCWLLAVVTLLAENVTTRDKTDTTFAFTSADGAGQAGASTYSLRSSGLLCGLFNTLYGRGIGRL